MPAEHPVKVFRNKLRTLTNWELCEELSTRAAAGQLDELMGRVTAGWLIVQEMAARFVKLSASSELSDVITDPAMVDGP